MEKGWGGILILKENKGNVRRGGLFLIGSTIIALMIAFFSGAPHLALLSIGLFGLGGGLTMLIIG